MSVRKISARLAVVAVAAAGLSATMLGPAQATIPSPTDGQEKYYDLSNSGVLKNASIQAGALIGVGSDTIQFLDGDIAEAYNSTNSLAPGSAGALTSLSACQAPGTTVGSGSTAVTAGPSTLTSCVSSGNFSETFPTSGSSVKLAGSSGSGANALDGGAGAGTTATALPDVAFARGSGTKNTGTLDDLPFAVDQLVAVVSNNVPSNAPATITLNELAGIYSGIYTNWAQLGGHNAPIHAYYINDPSSGTYQFFGKQLESEEGKSTSDSGVAAYAQHGTEGQSTSFVSNVDLSGNPIKEHDPSAIESDPDAITAMSYSRIKLSAAENGGTPAVKQLGGYIADRAVYTFLRDWNKMAPENATTWPTTGALAGVNPDWVTNVPAALQPADYATNNLETKFFGAWNTQTNTGGLFCNPAEKSIIEQEGFFQLDPSVCGKPVTSDPTLTAADMPAISKVSGALPATGTQGSTQISAAVAPKSGTGTPTGSVTFSFIPVNAPGAGANAGGSVTATLSGGVATATIPASVPSGTYQVAATYSGDSSFQPGWTDYDVTGGSAPVPSTIVIGTPKTTTTTTTPPPSTTTKPLTKEQKKLAKDKKALKKAKKAYKKAHGAKKTKLKKKIAKLKKAIKKDKKLIKQGK